MKFEIKNEWHLFNGKEKNGHRILTYPDLTQHKWHTDKRVEKTKTEKAYTIPAHWTPSPPSATTTHWQEFSSNNRARHEHTPDDLYSGHGVRSWVMDVVSTGTNKVLISREKITTVHGRKIEEFYWACKSVVYISGHPFKGTYKQAKLLVRTLEEATQ